MELGSLSSNQSTALPITLGFEDLRLALRVDPKKVVVSDVSGVIRSGTVTAVMGLSGCGKTSFITAVADRAYYGITTGKVTVNGVEMSLRDLSKLVCFVPQEDTVEETLYFSARTRLPQRTTDSEIRTIVNHVMEMLSLTHIRNSPIGDENKRGISGGQRKRVNVGMELVALPSVLFLDEPTSGLDAASSMEMANCLQRLAQNGINVITVIHQPRFEIFQKMDNLLLLGKGGLTLYYGLVSESVEYFESLGFVCPNRVNPADFFLDVCSGFVENDQGEKMNQGDFALLWKQVQDPMIRSEFREMCLDGEEEKEMKKKIRKALKSRKTPHCCQFVTSIRRGLLSIANDLGGFILGIALLLVCGGGLVGLLYQGAESSFGDLMSQTQMFTLILTLCVVLAALPRFGNNRALFIRENSAGLNSFWHFVANNLVEIPAIVIAPLAFTTVHFFLAAPLGSFETWYGTALGLTFATYGLGYVVSLVIPRNAMVGAIVLVMSLSLCAGLVGAISEIEETWAVPLNYLPWVSFVRFSSETLFVSEAAQLTYIPNLEDAVEAFGYKLGVEGRNTGILFAFGMAFRIAAYICLVCSPPYSHFNMAIAFLKSFISKIRSFFWHKFVQTLDAIFGRCLHGKKGWTGRKHREDETVGVEDDFEDEEVYEIVVIETEYVDAEEQEEIDVVVE